MPTYAGVKTANPHYHGLDFEFDEGTGAITEVYVQVSYDIVDSTGRVLKREADRVPLSFSGATSGIKSALQSVWSGVIQLKLDEYA